MVGETQRTILVVDDEAGVRLVLERMLGRLGYRVLSAVTGAEALDVIAGHPEIELIVLDLGLPDMSGDQVIARLRERQTSVPVLLSSGVSAEELEQRLTDGGGVAGVLRKPFRLPDLKSAVAACLEA